METSQSVYWEYRYCARAPWNYFLPDNMQLIYLVITISKTPSMLTGIQQGLQYIVYIAFSTVGWV
jgi:hypothetical protein